MAPITYPFLLRKKEQSAMKSHKQVASKVNTKQDAKIKVNKKLRF